MSFLPSSLIAQIPKVFHKHEDAVHIANLYWKYVHLRDLRESYMNIYVQSFKKVIDKSKHKIKKPVTQSRTQKTKKGSSVISYIK